MRRRTVAGALLALAGAVVLVRAGTARRHEGASAGGVAIRRSLTVEKPRAEVYRRWREPETQRLVWDHVAQIAEASEQSARWRVSGPLGRTLEWETRIVEEREGELVRWESSGDLPNEGTVEFRDAPGEHGTVVTVHARFDPPAGPLGEAAARLFDEPPKLVLAKALRRFKSLVETGEIPTTDRNPSAREG